MSAATQAGRPSRVVVRWYQLAVVVLGLALAAVTVLAVYLALNNSAAAATPATGSGYSGTGNSGTVADQPCWRPQVPC
jgi:hypothetical protein